MRRAPDFLRWISIALLLTAVGLIFYELVRFSRTRAHLPDRLTVAEVPLGGLDQGDALERLLRAYSAPVELYYGDQLILLNPSSVGFRLDSEAMLAAAELARTGGEFWGSFWDFLWSRPGEAQSIPVRSELSSAQLEAVLRDIAARYDEPPQPAEPVPGSPTFSPGKPGRQMDVARAAALVSDVLSKPANRRVNLPVVSTSAPRPSLPTLEILLEQNLAVADFTGVAAIYIMDLRTGEELHFAVFEGRDIPAEPDIAFTAASMIKVGILVAFYQAFDDPLDTEAEKLLAEMIELSGNDPADWLMERIGQNRGPLTVTDTLEELGLENTFIAGFFRPSELLRVYRTPGNQREDVNTRPDIFNQTSASEMGMLLADIYSCAGGGGTLIAVFPEQLRANECRKMLELLSRNKIGILIEAGVPEGTRVAHKHGWTNSPLDTVGDAGVVYSPGGDYVLTLFLWNDPEMIWEPTSKLVGELSRAVYNYFNPPLAP